jgi:hypothetical protein
VGGVWAGPGNRCCRSVGAGRLSPSRPRLRFSFSATTDARFCYSASLCSFRWLFFSHNKLANSTFSHDNPAKRTGSPVQWSCSCRRGFRCGLCPCSCRGTGAGSWEPLLSPVPASPHSWTSIFIFYTF